MQTTKSAVRSCVPVRYLLCGVLIAGQIGVAADGAGDEWRSYNGDAAASRYSPLKQINTRNVSKLKVAWKYSTGEMAVNAERAKQRGFSSIPLIVDGVMYVTTPSSRAIALDAETGAELWKYDAQVDRSADERLFQPNRGVSYWQGPSKDGRSLDRRVYLGTADGMMIALDAKTGRPVPQFAEDGKLDLRVGVAEGFPNTFYALTTPVAVFKDILIVGSRVQENPSEGPAGDIRAFDARTGKLVWQFHTVARPGEPGHDTWETGSWKNRSGVNNWGGMSVDEERGIVFVPLGSPSYDYYGGDRKGKNLYGDSLVALDAATGKVKWHFQTVHHDVWDYDLPSPPNLVVVKRDGKSIPAVAQTTKMGYVFFFHRETGEPVFPVEERPVPASTVPGESAWPTQPMPVVTPQLVRSRITLDDISDITPESKKHCTEWFKSVRHEGMYTPLGTEPTLFYPSTLGGGNWHGSAYDPTTGLLYTNVNEMGVVLQLEKVETRPGYALKRKPLIEWYFHDPHGWPCQKPPWGSLAAINVNTGKIAWKVPLGSVVLPSGKRLTETGSRNLGGATVTAGGLVFIAATTDQRFRAFDAATGKQVWETTLDASAHSTPVTYRSKKSGRQFVAITVGGGGFGSDQRGPWSDTVVAFKLPE